MLNMEAVIRCDGCGVEITWSAVVVKEQHYCCEDCRQGRPCACAERLELEDERRGSGISAVAESS